MEHPGTAAAADDRERVVAELARLVGKAADDRERVVAELARLVGKVNPPRMGDGHIMM